MYLMPGMKPPARFDFASAIARMDRDSTTRLREMHPDLSWVWDELDELRADADEAVDPADMAACEKELKDALDEVDSLRDAMKAALDTLDTVEDTTDAPATRAVIESAAAALAKWVG